WRVEVPRGDDIHARRRPHRSRRLNFFFQAEDGIRGPLVTGVQTCALPILLGAVVPAYNVPGVTQEIDFTPEALAGIFLGKITKRSEERRVGKESRRLRWRHH